MKKIFIFLFIASIIAVFPQQPLWKTHAELFLVTQNIPDTSNVMELYLTSKSQCWDTFNNQGNITFPKTTLHYFDTLVPPKNNFADSSWGFDFVTSQDPGIPHFPVFTYGLYKVTNNLNYFYFYLDFRDDEYGFFEIFHYIDVFINYDYSVNTWQIHRESGNTSTISLGEVKTIWSLMGFETPETYKFSDFWENSLVVYKDINNHPLLIWGGYIESSTIRYKVYRKYDQYSPNFIQIKETDNKTFSYTDTSITYASPGQMIGAPIEYYVKAVDDSYQLSDPTNIVDVYINGNFPEKSKASLISGKQVSVFNLSQCYPNPFNPSTNISYQLPEPGLVQLKIFNLLGKEVAVLVNEFKGEGKYSVNFDAKGLPSGVYIYSLKVNGLVQNQKMTLMK